MDLHRRTIFITLLGGAPWGFRLIGGGTKPLRISKIRRRSKAHQNGLQPGDILISINGAYCSYATHEYAVRLISQCMNGLTLEVEREQDRVLVFHNDVADYYEEPDPEEAFMPYEEIHVAEVRFVPEDPRIKPASDDITPISMEKLLKEATPEPILVSPKSPRKVYGDSTFFNDPMKNFPTIEEEKEMARRVAQALTDIRNKDSRGASMFEKRRQRSAKWVTQTADEIFGTDTPENGTPAPATPAPFGYSLSGIPIPPPPPPPPAPEAAKSVQEFVEEMKKTPKSKHNVVPPTTCFDIAAALHNNDGRGAQIFARRRAKSDKWVVQPAREPSPPPQPAKVLPTPREPLVVTRIGLAKQPPPPPPPPPKPQTPVALARAQTRQTANENQQVFVSSRYTTPEPGNTPQVSLGVQKLPPLQTKTFNTQPRGWRPF